MPPNDRLSDSHTPSRHSSGQEAKKVQNDPTTTHGESNNKPKGKKSNIDKTWNFEADYNDHFETPKQAYEDLQYFLNSVSTCLGKSNDNTIIYDPYFCKGKMKEYCQEIGYPAVVNENRDFYEDIRCNRLPEFDMLVTNPPYSGEHKMKLLQYLRTIPTKPFALLLPVYIVTKSYWKEFIQHLQNQSLSVLYLLPPNAYEYSHPEGTGKDLPPFYSAWLLGNIPLALTPTILQTYQQHARRNTATIPINPLLRNNVTRLQIVQRIEEMIALKVVSAEKRPNPKQRKKLQATKMIKG